MANGFEYLPKNDYDRLKKKAEDAAIKRQPKTGFTEPATTKLGQGLSPQESATITLQRTYDSSLVPGPTPQGALEQRKAGGQGNAIGENNAGVGAASGQLGQTAPAGGQANESLAARTTRSDLGGSSFVRGVQPEAANAISSLTPTSRTPGTDVAGPATSSLGATTASGATLTPRDAENVISNDQTFQERYAAYRAANPEQSRVGGGQDLGPSYGERLQAREERMDIGNQLGDIDRAIRRGAISARSGIRAKEDIMERAQEGTISRAKLAQQAQQQLSEEALARDKMAAESALEREKLVSGEAIAGAKLGQAQREAAMSAEESARKFALDVEKYGLEREKYGTDLASKAFEQQIDEAQLGLRGRELGVKQEGATTSASRAVADSLRALDEGFGDMRSVRAQASKLGQTSMVLQRDDEAQALIKRFQSNDPAYGQKELAADLKRLGYETTETE